MLVAHSLLPLAGMLSNAVYATPVYSSSYAGRSIKESAKAMASQGAVQLEAGVQIHDINPGWSWLGYLTHGRRSHKRALKSHLENLHRYTGLTLENIQSSEKDDQRDDMQSKLDRCAESMAMTDMAGTKCNVGGQGNATKLAIIAGEENLKNIDNCRVEKGPGTCSRVQCTAGGGGIWVCNDNTHAIDPSGKDVANYVEYLINTCTNYPKLKFATVRGQVFDSSGYNVVAAYDSSC